jgi:hypothetical protein
MESTLVLKPIVSLLQENVSTYCYDKHHSALHTPCPPLKRVWLHFLSALNAASQSHSNYSTILQQTATLVITVVYLLVTHVIWGSNFTKSDINTAKLMFSSEATEQTKRRRIKTKSSQVLLRKLTDALLVNRHFHNARHWDLPRATTIESMSHHSPFIFTLLTHIHLISRIDFFFSWFSTKNFKRIRCGNQVSLITRAQKSEVYSPNDRVY